jgi:hypothetical protein
MNANVVIVSCLAIGAASAAARAAPFIIPTNLGLGADAEVREGFADTNRGASNELATRVKNDVVGGIGGNPNDAGDRNSVMYLQYDLSGVSAADLNGVVLRLTFRNNNLPARRITDTDGSAPDFGQNGLEYYGIADYQFDESTITYNNAKGMSPDGDIGTKDFNADASLLGSADFPLIGDQSHLPIGGPMDFQSMALDAFLAAEILAGRQTAVIAVVHRNDGAAGEPQDWINLNYLFNPKELTTLNNDATYDADINDPNNPLGGPWSGADNSTGAFSPQLLITPVPEPGTLALLSMGLMAMMFVRRVRQGVRNP